MSINAALVVIVGATAAQPGTLKSVMTDRSGSGNPFETTSLVMLQSVEIRWWVVLLWLSAVQTATWKKRVSIKAVVLRAFWALWFQMGVVK